MKIKGGKAERNRVRDRNEAVKGGEKAKSQVLCNDNRKITTYNLLHHSAQEVLNLTSMTNNMTIWFWWSWENLVRTELGCRIVSQGDIKAASGGVTRQASALQSTSCEAWAWPLGWASHFFISIYNLHVVLPSTTGRNTFSWDCWMKEMHNLVHHRNTNFKETWTQRSKQWSVHLGVQLTYGNQGNLPSHVVSSSDITPDYLLLCRQQPAFLYCSVCLSASSPSLQFSFYCVIHFTSLPYTKQPTKLISTQKLTLTSFEVNNTEHHEPKLIWLRNTHHQKYSF